MATYTTTKTSSTSVVPSRAGVAETHAWETYTVPTGLVLNDIIQMVKIPAGATVLDVKLSSTATDTGSVPALRLEVGDGDDPNRYITASDIGVAGGIAVLNAQAGHCYAYAAEDTIDIKVSTAAHVQAAGTFRLDVVYTMEP